MCEKELINELIESAEVVENEDGTRVMQFIFKENQTEKESELIKKFILGKLK